MTNRLDALLADLAVFPDWEQRYEYVIDLGKALPPMPDALKVEAHRVRGCTAQVWLVPALEDGKLKLVLGSDALIVKGLLAFVKAGYEDLMPVDALAHDFMERLNGSGLMQHLSANRRNGLASVVQKIRDYCTSVSC